MTFLLKLKSCQNLSSDNLKSETLSLFYYALYFLRLSFAFFKDLYMALSFFCCNYKSDSSSFDSSGISYIKFLSLSFKLNLLLISSDVTKSRLISILFDNSKCDLSVSKVCNSSYIKWVY